MGRIKKAVYIGRFQPFTKTHRKVVQFVDAEPDIQEIVIIKGSIQWNDKNPDPFAFPSRNPFTAEECCEMIKLSLSGPIKKPWRIIQIPDTSTKMTDPLWKEWVNSIIFAVGTSGFIVYTNDPREVRAFEAVGCETRPFPVSPLFFRATLVRKSIARENEKKWKKYVDQKVAEYIKKIRGPARIAKLLELDKKEIY